MIRLALVGGFAAVSLACVGIGAALTFDSVGAGLLATGVELAIFAVFLGFDE